MNPDAALTSAVVAAIIILIAFVAAIATLRRRTGFGDGRRKPISTAPINPECRPTLAAWQAELARLVAESKSTSNRAVALRRRLGVEP